MKIPSSIATSADVYRLIEDARDAELCRNLELFREILSSFWDDIEAEPDLSNYSPTDRGELLRLCGVYLSQFGRARGLADHQLRARDFLFKALRQFEAAGAAEKAAEAKVAFANCFWFSGEVREYDDLISAVEEEFGANPGHPVSIQIALNRIFVAIWKGDREQAEHYIDAVSEVITANHDFRLRTQFHNLSGIVFRIADKLDFAEMHLKQAVRIAKEAGNSMFVAFNLNNLAMVYRNGGQPDKALSLINESVAIMESRGDRGWIPHALDTKALIFFQGGDYTKALETIEESVQMFSEGEDYSGLIDSMWTRCLCLLRLDRVSEAVIQFADLKVIAARQIGEVAVDKFAKNFAAEVYACKDFPLTDEVAGFKRARVIKAMRENGCHVAKAAKALGLRSQQALSEILNNQFPDIYDELGIKRRAKRADAKPKQKEEPSEPGVARLLMPKTRTYSFNFVIDGREPEFYYFPKRMMREEFGIGTDSVVAIMPVNAGSLQGHTPVLYVKDDVFRMGSLSFDAFSGLFLVDLEEFTFLSDVTLLGEPVGYCPASQRNKQMMTFEPLRIKTK